MDKLRRRVHHILLGGVWSAGALIALGLASAVLGPRAPLGDGSSLAALGILLLIATPFLRVAALALGYAQARRWALAAQAGAALAMMLLGALLR